MYLTVLNTLQNITLPVLCNFKILMSPFLWMKKLRHRNSKQLVHHYNVNKWKQKAQTPVSFPLRPI